jgi:cytoskeletal protein CcmA (bactofilin family)
MRLRVVGLALGLLAIAVPAVVLASANDSMTLAKGQTHTGTYYAGAQTVIVDGDVHGDVVCGAQDVTINGVVDGDVLCAGQNVTINGAVTGSVRVAGQSVTINNTVGRNVTVAGQMLHLGSAAKVSGEEALAGQNVTIDGPNEHVLNVAGQNVVLNSTIGGDVNAAVGQLALGTDANIAGSLTYTAQDQSNINKSKVQGSVTYHMAQKHQKQQTTAQAWAGRLLYWIVAGTVAMLLAVWLLPRAVRSVTADMLKRPGRSFGFGAIALIVAPALLLVLLLTVIGIPLALWLTAAWILLLAAAGPFAGVALGQLVLGRQSPDKQFLLKSVLVGVPLITIALSVPWLGPLLALVAVVWVVGGVLLTLLRTRAAA